MPTWSVSTALAAELRRDAPNVIQRVDLGWMLGTTPTADHLMSFHRTPRDGVTPVDYSKPYLQSVSNPGIEIDPLSGVSSVSALTVTVSAMPEVLTLINGTALEGKEIGLRIGIPGTLGDGYENASTRWPLLWRGLITRVKVRGRTVTFEGNAADYVPDIPTDVAVGRRLNESIPSDESTGSACTTNHTTAFCTSAHPLEAIAEALETVAGLPARFIDSDSLDFTDLANDAIAHYRCAKFACPSRDNRLVDSEPVWAVTKGLAYLTNGVLFLDEWGRATFSLYDDSAAAVYDFAEGIDIEKATIEAYNRIEDVVGTVVINTHWSQQEDGDGESTQQYLARMSLSEDGTLADYGYLADGSEEAHQTFEINDQWFGVMATNDAAWDHTINSVVLNADYEHGDDGVTYNTANDSRVGYGWPGVGVGIGGVCGVVEAISGSRKGYVIVVDDEAADYAIYSYSGITLDSSNHQVTLATLAKVAGDDIDAAAGELHWYDCTAIFNLAQGLLARFSDTCAVVNFTTNMRSIEVQVADLVTLDTTRIHCFGINGDPGAQKWQIVGKELDLDNWRINWKLLQGRDETIAVTYYDHGLHRGQDSPAFAPRPEQVIGSDAIINAGLAHAWVDRWTDFGWDAAVITIELPIVAAGLAQVLPGISYMLDGQYKGLPTISHIFGANLDTYIFLGGSRTARGRLTYSAVANNAAQPATPASHIPWCMVRTNGANITAVTDLADRGAVGTKGMQPWERLSLHGSESWGDATLSGFAVPTGAGFSKVVAVGTAVVAGKRTARRTAESHTFTASRDTYIDIDAAGVLYYNAVAIGNGEPMVAPGRHRVGVVLTDGAGVTACGRIPETRRSSTRAIAPNAIRDGFASNALLDDIDKSKPLPWGWTKAEAAGVSIDTTAQNSCAGHYTIKVDVPNASLTSTLQGTDPDGCFPIMPENRYSARIPYRTDTFARAPTLSIGLEYFDEQMQSIAVRYAVCSAKVPAVSVDAAGFTLEATIKGSGSGADEIPPTARYARWVATIDNNPAGNAGIWFSAFTLEVSTRDATALIEEMVGKTYAANHGVVVPVNRGNAVGGAFAANLPAAATVPNRTFYFIKIDASGNAYNVTPNGAETINGAGGALALAVQWATAALHSDGANWIRLF